MKPWLHVFFALSVLCVLPAGNAPAASGGYAGVENDEKRPLAAPLAEMILYEAAEQAVEDGYAHIVPESEAGTRQDTADTSGGQAGQAAAPSGVEPENMEE